VSSVVLASGFFDLQLRVPATGPVDQHYDFGVLLINIRDDLLDEDANDSLFQAHVRSGSPHAREIMGRAHQQFLVRYCRSAVMSIKGADALFDFLYFL
jgi:hypothetical protein